MITRIRKVIADSEASQKEIADACNVTPQYISWLMKHDCNPSKAFCASLCDYLHINIEWLKSGEGEMNEPYNREDILISYLNEIIKDEQQPFKRQLIASLVEMTPEQWQALATFVNSIKK